MGTLRKSLKFIDNEFKAQAFTYLGVGLRRGDRGEGRLATGKRKEVGKRESWGQSHQLKAMAVPVTILPLPNLLSLFTN